MLCLFYLNITTCPRCTFYFINNAVSQKNKPNLKKIKTSATPNQIKKTNYCSSLLSTIPLTQQTTKNSCNKNHHNIRHKTKTKPNQKTKQTTAIAAYFQQSHSLNKQQKTHATKPIITSDTKQNQIFNYLQCCVFFLNITMLPKIYFLLY